MFYHFIFSGMASLSVHHQQARWAAASGDVPKWRKILKKKKNVTNLWYSLSSPLLRKILLFSSELSLLSNKRMHGGKIGRANILGDFSVSNCGENILTIFDDTKKSWRNGSSFKGDLKRNSQGKFKSDHDFWYFDNFGRKLFVIRASYILFPFSHKTTRLWWVAANIFETNHCFDFFRKFSMHQSCIFMPSGNFL